MEICGNLTKTSEHERIKREIERARELGCKRFVFLINHPTIKNVGEVYTWKVPRNRYGRPYTKVKPETLQKIMLRMQEKYNVEFLFCRKLQMGKMVVEILKGENNV